MDFNADVQDEQTKEKANCAKILKLVQVGEIFDRPWFKPLLAKDGTYITKIHTLACNGIVHVMTRLSLVAS